MAKQAISANDLSWIVLEELREAGFSPQGIAIVSDGKGSDWRVVVEARSRTYMQKDDMRRLEAIEKKLRTVYALAD
jgi:hypothetical protein